MNKKTTKVDVDSPKVRFLGWLPSKKPSIVLLVLVLIYYATAIFLWTRMPQKLIFGWWPFHYFIYCFVYTPVLMVILGVYYYKFWPELDDDKKQAEIQEEDEA